MNRLIRITRTSIGKKLLMALSGIGLFVFLIIHLAGNLNMFAGRDAMNEYAATLREHPVILWGGRGGLILFFIGHFLQGIQLTLQNRAARPVGYRVNTSLRANWASRNMVISGLLLFSYLVYHLLHYTLGVTDPSHFSHALAPDQLGRPDVYSMVIYGFRSPIVSGVYIAAMLFVGLHLWHGVQSSFQTAGINHSAYNSLLRRGAKALVFLLIAGFCAIPVSILLGLLQLPGEG